MTSDPRSLELEERIHALLCGDLDPAEARKLLGQVASSEPARQMLRDMLDLEKKARAAYGHNEAQAVLESSRERLLQSLRGASAVAGPKDAGPKVQPASRPAPGWRRSLLPVAAAAAVLVSLSVALIEYGRVRSLDNEAGRLAALVQEKETALASAQQKLGAAHGLQIAQRGLADGRGLSQLWKAVAVSEDWTAPKSATNLKNTIVTPHLEQEILEGKNVLWCATFQAAWNELMDLSGGPVRMQPLPPAVESLNKRAVTKDVMGAGDYVAAGGLVGDGLIERIKADIDRTFKGGFETSLLPAPGSLPPDMVVMYSCLVKKMPFKHKFPRPDMLSFNPSPPPPEPENPDGPALPPRLPPRVASFGIVSVPMEGSAEAACAEQVRILWHRFLDKEKPGGEQEFIVELLTTSETDRLILAELKPEKTLAATVGRVMRLLEKPNTLTAKDIPEDLADADIDAEQISKYSCLVGLETIQVPVINVNLLRSFPELCGPPILSDNPKLSGKPIVSADQLIRFRLDETGASLESESMTAAGGIPARNFWFDRPFLILLVRKGAAMPYFAMWVGNKEFMEPIKAPTESTIAPETPEPEEESGAAGAEKAIQDVR